MNDLHPASAKPGEKSSSAWAPIFAGEAADRVRAVIEEVAAALRQSTADMSLAGGRAGLAVFFAALAKAGLAADAEELAMELVNDAVEAIAATPSGASLYAGFTGTAWAVAHLEGRLFEAGEEDANEAVDVALRELLGRSPWRGEFDIVSGLVGIGVYALERLPRAPAIECLELVLDRLGEMAERTAAGVAWASRPELLPADARKDGEGRHYNLGVAHGVPGVIAFLGQVCARDEAALRSAGRKARALLNGAVAWLLAQEPTDRAVSFSYWVGPGLTPTPARLAWCYGDLGIAVALLQAARGAREPAWEREALRIAHRAASRPAEQSGAVDCGLCHGAAGIGHLFNRLFQATGDETLGNAARFWFARALEMRRPGEGIAGFLAMRPDPERPDEKRWVEEQGILEGAAGVALALLAATTAIEPQWDGMLLVSIPAAKVT